MTTTVTKQNPDGTVETKTTTKQTLKEKLEGELTWAQKLDAMYPTPNADVITKGWEDYDKHKLFK